MRIDSKGNATFERLSDGIEEIGIELGRPPICTYECGAQWRALAAAVMKSLFRSQTVADFERSRARTFYEYWAQYSEVSAWLSAKENTGFFKWLLPEASERPPYAPAEPNTDTLWRDWLLPPALQYAVPAFGFHARGEAWAITVNLENGRTTRWHDGQAEPEFFVPARKLKSLRMMLKAAQQERPMVLDQGAGAPETLVIRDSRKGNGRLIWRTYAPGSKGQATDALFLVVEGAGEPALPEP